MGGQGQEQFKGHTGQVAIDGNALVLSRQGFAAKAAGVSGDDLRIPLASVSAVALKLATHMANGSLRLGLNGAEPPAEKDAVGSPMAVVFTWQQREPFERLHGWLCTVVERNRALGLLPQLGQFIPRTDTGEARRGDNAAGAVAPGPAGEAVGATPLDQEPRWDSDIERRNTTSESPGVGQAVQEETTSSRTPKWYPDPTGRFQFRYWDGAAWTEHASSDGTRSTDPFTHPEASDEPTQEVDAPKKQGMLARMREKRHAKAAGRDEFETLAMHAAADEPAAVAALPQALARARTLYRAGPLEKKLWDTMAVAVRSVIDDDVVSLEEEQHLYRLGEILGTPLQELELKDYSLFEELVIAGINAGRLPRLDSPGMILKRGEVAYASFAASLIKEQAVREYHAGIASVSVPLGGGVRYRVGGVRGRSVVVGTELVVQDSGRLFITSQRTLYTGQVKTLEFRNDRLVGLEQYTDGLRLNVSNRQTASLFKMEAPSIAAALISASVARDA